MSVQESIQKLLAAENLSTAQSREAFHALFSQRLSFDEAKTLLLLLAGKGETADELMGCLEALRELEPPGKPPVRGTIDTCGTGGDKSQSINVSTVSVLIVAAAGGSVAKHGNRAISSRR